VKWVLIGGLVGLFILGVIFVWRKPEREAVSRPAAELDGEVRHGLDDIKETLFRLELRKQAGTISEDEYAQERRRAEKLLRQLVRG